ncbi:unnamed protein product [Parajaminaea phylloscopi]
MAPPSHNPAANNPALGLYLAQRVLLVTQDGRLLLGDLQGFDGVGSVILSNTVERIFTASGEDEDGGSVPGGMEEVELGLYVLRGDAICLIGDVDTAKDASIDWTSLDIEGIPEVRHQ